MAEITGLSQSQVYKWFWDQKKKNSKDRDEGSRGNLDRRKIIHKNLNYRHELYHSRDIGRQKIDREVLERDCSTKVKASSVLGEDSLKTDKKVNKKLIFQ